MNQSTDKTSYKNNNYNLKVQSQRKIGYLRKRKADINYCCHVLCYQMTRICINYSQETQVKWVTQLNAILF